MNTPANPGPSRDVFTATLRFFLIFVSNAFAQESAEVTEVERVIVTGSNIPTAEETGPNPVDTYRPADLEKLGIRNATDLTTFLPQEAGGTTNLNISNGGLGTVQQTGEVVELLSIRAKQDSLAACPLQRLDDHGESQTRVPPGPRRPEICPGS